MESLSRNSGNENSALVAEYLETLAAPRTRYTVGSILSRFVAWLGIKPVLSVGYEELQRYFLMLRDDASITLRTKELYWGTVRGFMEYVAESRDIHVNIPKRTVKFVKFGNKPGPASKARVMSRDEVVAFRDRVKLVARREYIWVYLLADCGMRVSELATIRIENVDVGERYLVTGMVEGARKTGEAGYFFSPECARELARYMMLVPEGDWLFPSPCKQGRPVLGETIEDFIVRTRDDPSITTHTFRKSLNTLRAGMGCDLEIRKILLNHKVNDVNVTNYTMRTRKEKRDLYDKFYPY